MYILKPLRHFPLPPSSLPASLTDLSQRLYFSVKTPTSYVKLLGGWGQSCSGQFWPIRWRWPFRCCGWGESTCYMRTYNPLIGLVAVCMCTCVHVYMCIQMNMWYYCVGNISGKHVFLHTFTLCVISMHCNIIALLWRYLPIIRAYTKGQGQR